MKFAIDEITIENFKSICLLNSLKLKDINLLVGKNDTGKTNFLLFFEMLHNIAIGSFNRWQINNDGFRNIVYNKKDLNENIYGKIKYNNDFLEISIDKNLNLNCHFVDKYFKDIVFYHFHDTSSTSGMRNYEIVEDDKILRTDASNIAPFLLKLKEHYKKEYNDVLNAVCLIMPFFHDFILEPRKSGNKNEINLSWTQKGSDYPMQPYHLSDGSIRFICLATTLLQPNPPATIIIDEPELGLHPAAIVILAELIQVASTRTQLIIATQSPALIDQFGIEDIIVVNRENGSSTFKRLEEKSAIM